MALLVDVFRDQSARVRKTIVAIDIVSSTAMKEKDPEASWLSTFAWFYDLCTKLVNAQGGNIVKFIGDGVMAVFSEDKAAEAINCAITLQEQVAEANAARTVALHCCVGLATGHVTEFDATDGSTVKDYLGSVVDKAFRLCSAANAKAVFVDKATVDAAPMHKVKCKIGESTAVKRATEDYLGTLESIPAKGFSKPVQYHEILWDLDRYGVNPKYVSQVPATESAPVATRDLPPQRQHDKWMKGTVSSINSNFGFLQSNGEDFWFNEARLFRSTMAPKIGEPVWFIPKEPMPSAKNRQATNILRIGAQVDGSLVSVKPSNYGFVACTNSYGEQRTLFVYLNDSSKWKEGMEITFTVTENKEGIAGTDPQPK